MRFTVYQEPDGGWRVYDGTELEGWRSETEAEAQEYCDFINNPDVPDWWTLGDYRLARSKGWIE